MSVARERATHKAVLCRFWLDVGVVYKRLPYKKTPSRMRAAEKESYFAAGGSGLLVDGAGREPGLRRVNEGMMCEMHRKPRRASTAIIMNGSMPALPPRHIRWDKAREVPIRGLGYSADLVALSENWQKGLCHVLRILSVPGHTVEIFCQVGAAPASGSRPLQLFEMNGAVSGADGKSSAAGVQFSVDGGMAQGAGDCEIRDVERDGTIAGASLDVGI